MSLSAKPPRFSGFTLIELLVSIAVLSIVVTAVIVLLNPAKHFKLSRDAQRKSDFQTLQTALELYYQDNYIYPNTAAVCETISSTSILGLALSPETGSKYIKTLPTDPKGGSYQYWSDTEGKNYWLVAEMEVEDNNENSPCLVGGAPGSLCGVGASYCYGVENSF